MAKDPAFLFYSSDFLTGTVFFNNEQLGKYIKLLCIQHQHEGRIDNLGFETIVNGDEIVRQKFKKDDSGWYNLRLNDEILKRKKASDASRNNGKQGGRPISKPKQNQQVIKTKPKQNLSEDENENINGNKSEFDFEIIFPFNSENFKNIWHQFLEFRKSIKKPLKPISQQAQLKSLSKYTEPVATEMIEQSIANGWQGIFELKNKTNGKQQSDNPIDRAQRIREMLKTN